MYIPSFGNNFPPVASDTAEGTDYAAANLNLSNILKQRFIKLNLFNQKSKESRIFSCIFNIFSIHGHLPLHICNIQ